MNERNRMKSVFTQVSGILTLSCLLGLSTATMVTAGEASVTLTGALTSADIGQTDIAAGKLSRRLQSIQSLSADFMQETVQMAGRAPQVTSGHMTVQRPDNFRWEVKEPYPQLVIAGASLVTVYDPDLEQAVIRKMDQSLHDTPALLLSGDTSSLNQSYEINVVADGDNESYQLKPRSGERLFEVLEIRFKGKHLENMKLTDGLGAETRIRFTGLEENTKIDPELFQFTPPKGTDVINEVSIKSRL